MKLFRHAIGALALAGLLGSGVVDPMAAHAAPSVITDASIPDVAERVVDSVVNISVYNTAAQQTRIPADEDPFFDDEDSPGYRRPTPRQKASKGSGVIITSGGRILTNAHVVHGAKRIVVTLHDHSEYEATAVGIDRKADLAVIQLKGKVPALKPLAFGDSNALRLGEVVLAVGDPFGVGKSVTMGIVSAKGRSGMNIEEYEDFIQTDAAINPGNSGGPLVNLKGEIVGINTAIASKSGGYAGISFAIPSNMAKPIMEMLVKDGRVVRGYLGVSITTVTAALQEEYRLGAGRGAVISSVQQGSPAHKAGLVEGDVITAINGTEVRSSDVLRNTIAMIKPGTTVEFAVTSRNASKKVVKAKLGELPDDNRRR